MHAAVVDLIRPLAADGIRAPQPAHDVRERGAQLLAAVSVMPLQEKIIVAHPAQRGGHVVVGLPPTARVNVQVVVAVLQIHADRLGFHFADQIGIHVAAVQAGETADAADHFAEDVGPFPSGGERATAAGTSPDQRAARGIFGQCVAFLDFRQNFVDQKPSVTVADGIVFKRAVLARLLDRALLLLRRSVLLRNVDFDQAHVGRRQRAGIDEDADRHEHFFFMNQIVEHDRRAHLAFFADRSAAVLKNNYVGRRLRIVLSRDVDPPIAFSSWKNFTKPFRLLFDFAARHPFMNLRIRTVLIFIRSARLRGQA